MRITGFRTAGLVLAALTAVAVTGAAEPAVVKTAEPAAPDLAELKAVYDKALVSIVTNCDAVVKGWPGDYMAALKRLQASMQKDGDLDGWGDVKAELDRFQEANSIAEVNLSKRAELAALQARFKDVPVQAAYEKNKKIVTLSQKYMTRLESVQRDLTKKGEMASALDFNAELKRIKASPEFTSACFEVAEYESRKQAEAPGAAVGAKVEAPVKHEESAAKSDEKSEKPSEKNVGPGGKFMKPGDGSKPMKPGEGGKGMKSGEGGMGGGKPMKMMEGGAPPQEESKIYDSKQAPNIPGVTFKAMQMHPTANAGTKRVVNLTASLGSVSSETSSGEASDYYVSRSKSGSTSFRVRVGLKSSSTTVLENAVVVVEYFSREIGNTSKKIVPERMMVEHIEVPKIDTQGVVIDCPAVSTYKSSYRSSSAYGSNYHDKSGRDFYGALISVYDANKTLVQQLASGNAIDSLATTEMQPTTKWSGYESSEEDARWRDGVRMK